MKHPIVRVLGGLLTITVVFDVLGKPHAHTEYWWHHFPGFEFLFGLAGAALLTLVSKKFLHHLIGRKENYYWRSAKKL